LTNSGGGNSLKYISLGSEIAVGLSAPILIGYWIDHSLETLPWFTLAGIVLGITILIFMLIRLSNELNRKEDS